MWKNQFDSADWKSMNSALSENDWKHLFNEGNDVNFMNDLITNTILSVVDIFIDEIYF